MTSYNFMSNKELGMDTYVNVDEIGKYIMFKGEDRTERERLYLEDEPIASQRAIVCKGTTCYRAKRENSKYEFVVKFSWRAERRTAEGNLLKLAKGKNVWDVARLFGHEDLEEIDYLRDGMAFGKPQTFRSTMVSEIQSLSLKENRKRSGETIIKPAKRSRTEGSGKLRDITNVITAEDDKWNGSGERFRVRVRRCMPMRCMPMRCTPTRCITTRCTPTRCTPTRCTPTRCTPMRCMPMRCTPMRCHRKTICVRSTPHANSPSPEFALEIAPLIHSDDKPEEANKDNIERPSGTNPTVLKSPFDNRILSCLVVSLPGRPISKFDSVKQFLEACRDFIEAHQSLLNEGRILHRDISENNVIITDGGGEGDPKGMLGCTSMRRPL
jgi:hypothetical protein